MLLIIRLDSTEVTHRPFAPCYIFNVFNVLMLLILRLDSTEVTQRPFAPCYILNVINFKARQYRGNPKTVYTLL